MACAFPADGQREAWHLFKNFAETILHDSHPKYALCGGCVPHTNPNKDGAGE
ncbi:hypothetical protein PHLCEN_2v5407 [Hermanssonia centrifuga]|uniref:Uncharacterized protein n=1 Tax=Hermanssonia centrifuga TaxID=98765 RepID=A0A1U7KL20_9APHY|nr:hypothetical protein PHLCEN_2v5407 [Hermanssonia centrifuga]